jgi:hypothetical protein
MAWRVLRHPETRTWQSKYAVNGSKITDLVETHMGGLGRGGIPRHLNRPKYAFCQGLGRSIAKERHFGRVTEGLERKTDEMAYLWRVASLYADGGGGTKDGVGSDFGYAGLLTAGGARAFVPSRKCGSVISCAVFSGSVVSPPQSLSPPACQRTASPEFFPNWLTGLLPPSLPLRPPAFSEDGQLSRLL